MVFLEERSTFHENEIENDLKIEKQDQIIEHLRNQIDILKTKCLSNNN